MLGFWIVVALITVAVGGVIYWWRRPVSWQDGEDSALHDEGPLLDTDLGRSRFWLFETSSENRLVGWLLNLRDWFENERRRR